MRYVLLVGICLYWDLWGGGLCARGSLLCVRFVVVSVKMLWVSSWGSHLWLRGIGYDYVFVWEYCL